MKKTLIVALIAMTSTVAFAQTNLDRLNVSCKDGETYYDSSFRFSVKNIQLSNIKTDTFKYDSDTCTIRISSDGTRVRSCEGTVDVRYIKSAKIKKQKLEYTDISPHGPHRNNFADINVLGGKISTEIRANLDNRLVPHYSGSIDLDPKSVKCNKEDSSSCLGAASTFDTLSPIKLTFDGVTKKAVQEQESGKQEEVICEVTDNLR